MFEFLLTHPSGRSDPDRPAALIVVLPGIGHDALTALPAYLIATLNARFDLTGIDTHLGARPIAFRCGGDSVWSERAIWNLLVELPDAADHVVNYVTAILERERPGLELEFCSCLDVVGQEAIYAYLDHCIRRYRLTLAGDFSDHLRVVASFIEFLRRCDMDHETYQDEYIQLVLSFLYWHDRSPATHRLLVDLLHFRLTTGQYSEPQSEYARYLADGGVLRAIVDRLLDGQPGWQLRVDLLRLCAVVYGSDQACIENVLAYCRQRAELGEAHDLKNFRADLNCLAAQRDAWLARHWPAMDTGFHVSERAARRWVPLTDGA